jgi:uncharacterized membrane protein
MSTKPHIILVVMLALTGAMFLGITFTFQLIREKADPGLIAVMAGFAGTALGAIAGTLNNTRTPGGGESTPVSVTNTPANPVNVQENP